MTTQETGRGAREQSAQGRRAAEWGAAARLWSHLCCCPELHHRTGSLRLASQELCGSENCGGRSQDTQAPRRPALCAGPQAPPAAQTRAKTSQQVLPFGRTGDLASGCRDTQERQATTPTPCDFRRSRALHSRPAGLSDLLAPGNVSGPRVIVFEKLQKPEIETWY